jgi:hypothetical protein
MNPSRVLLRSSAALVLGIGTVPAWAYVTVGPHGVFSTIQAGVNQALASGGGEVRVEVKYCTDIHGFQYVCAFKENDFWSSTHSVALSGGWASDFATPAGVRTWLQGGGANQQTLLLTGTTAGTTTAISGFDLNGSGTTPQYNTDAIRINASGLDVSVDVSANTVRNNGKQTMTIGGGGAGIFAQAGGGAVVSIHDNEFRNNSVLGLDAAATYAGAAYLSVSAGSQLAFENNVLSGNAISNPSGGACHGGAIWGEASGSAAQLTLDGNTLTGNQQFACTSGSTADAAEFHASGGAVIRLDRETWTDNNAINNPGVYEVFASADTFGKIHAGNGLITHATWGGLYAQTDATGSIVIVHFTIADNPVLGFNGVGAGTQLWNTILWNDGTPYASSGASLTDVLIADPEFVDATGGNYRLTIDSAAINGGYNNVPDGAYPTDRDGTARPYTGDGVSIADIGAYEYHANDRIFRGTFEPP